jgi:hypothetical protein
MLYQGHHRPAAKPLTDGQPLHGLKHRGGDAAGGRHPPASRRRGHAKDDEARGVSSASDSSARSDAFQPVRAYQGPTADGKRMTPGEFISKWKESLRVE